MTVRELTESGLFEPLVLPDGEREITGVYIGDLLSWVMGRAGSGDAWITIMSNANILAVATLADTACILLAEDVTPDDGVADLAAEKQINLLRSKHSAYETAVLLHQRL